MIESQGRLALGRCSFVAPEKDGSWRCTKAEGHTKEKGNKTHMALCATSLQPPFVVDFLHHWSK